MAQRHHKVGLTVPIWQMRDPESKMVKSVVLNPGCSGESTGQLLSDSATRPQPTQLHQIFWGETQATGFKVTWLVNRKLRTGTQYSWPQHPLQSSICSK